MVIVKDTRKFLDNESKYNYERNAFQRSINKAEFLPSKIISPKEWRGEELMTTTNCYAFALNFPIHPISGKVYHPLMGDLLQPGEISKTIFYRRKVLRPDKILDLVKADIKAIGGSFEKVDENTLCPKNSIKIAVAMDPGKDYHFYRQWEDGVWYHKRGDSNVTNKDAQGKIILSPEKADRKYSQNNYFMLLGYYMVTFPELKDFTAKS